MITRRGLMMALLASPLAKLLPKSVRPTDAEIFPAGIDPIREWGRIYDYQTFSMSVPAASLSKKKRKRLSASLKAEQERQDAILAEAIWGGR